MRITAEMKCYKGRELKIILEKSQNMRYGACVILAEEYNINWGQYDFMI